MNHLKTLAAAAALVLAPLHVANAAFSQIVSFGDSLSDHGSIFAATGGAVPDPGLGYFNGRFSNGPTWIDNLASDLGIASNSSFATGGTNYAIGGARVSTTENLDDTLNDGFILSAQQQVGAYLGSVSGAADPNALYTVLIGGNDLNAIDGVTYGIPELQADAANTVNLVSSLLGAGAENILVLNVPDLGGAPVADGNEAAATAATELFNFILEAGIAGLASPFVSLVDTFSVSQDIAANPGDFGLTNVDDACLVVLAGGGACNPNDFLFFDPIHPTAVGHALIGDAALAGALTLPAAVPVPAALPLFLSALAGFGAVRRLRK